MDTIVHETPRTSPTSDTIPLRRFLLTTPSMRASFAVVNVRSIIYNSFEMPWATPETVRDSLLRRLTHRKNTN